MDEKSMIEDLIAQLDKGMSEGFVHVHVDVDQFSTETKKVQTMGCPDCSKSPLAHLYRSTLISLNAAKVG